jgi:hypothetical protein
MKHQRFQSMIDVSHHPFSKSNVYRNDRIIDLLSRKICPVHLIPLVLYNVFRADDYIRKQYGCVSCRCTADFVGEELKSDSIGRSLYFIDLMREEQELVAAKTHQTDDEGKEV